jgi:L-fuconolactonase
MQRTDAHQHFWQIARGDYAWLRADDAGVAPLVRDFLPDALAPLLRTTG